MAYIVFGAAALCGVAVLVLGWPLLRTREHRCRVIGMLVATTVMGVCLVIGQKLFDDVLNHVRVHHSSKPVTAFGPVRVGEKIPSFSGVSETGTEIGPTTLGGRFHVHVIDDQLPPTCLNKECGEGPAAATIQRGGVLMGFSDGKAAKSMGVELASSDPWRFRTSLVVVTDSQGVVMSIYPGARLRDVSDIVKEHAE